MHANDKNRSKIHLNEMFTQGKKITIILSSLLCILETICQKRSNSGGKLNSVKSDSWKSSANDVALNC